MEKNNQQVNSTQGCDARVKTALEIIKERIKDDNELNVVLGELARQKTEISSLCKEINKLKKENDSLLFGLTGALFQLKTNKDFDDIDENERTRRAIFEQLKESER